MVHSSGHHRQWSTGPAIDTVGTFQWLPKATVDHDFTYQDVLKPFMLVHNSACGMFSLWGPGDLMSQWLAASVETKNPFRLALNAYCGAPELVPACLM